MNARDMEGNTALIIAADKNSLPAVEELVGNGAVVNARNKFGDTALIISCRNGAQDIGRYLIRNGADKYAVNDAGHTASDEAKDQSLREILLNS